MKKGRKIELLAPAKDVECGREAILHGADAVYIGAPCFSARSAAGNSVEDIKELCDFAHLYDARIYVALNTILYDNELEQAEKLIWDLYRIGADALIIQDMGILEMNLPPIPLHASTQMDNRTPAKVKFLEDIGFRQVVLARELSPARIEEIAGKTTVPLEVFVHGALCVSFSGQCYLSQAIRGRSANRGECAQYCRLPYDMIDAEGKTIVRQKHLLSLKDMRRDHNLENLLDAGVSSFKIEGRLKDVSYVKNITAYYRKKLDEIFVRRPEYMRTSTGRSVYKFDPKPEKSFNRGFTPYFPEAIKEDITSFDTPKSIGEPVGRVKEVRGRTFTIAGLKTLNNGDGLAFFNPKGELEGFRVNKVEDNRIYPVSPVSLHPKMELYRNLDQEFEKQLSRSTAERKIAVRLEFLDNPTGFTLHIIDETEAGVMITSDFEKEAARSDQQKNICTQLSKLGNTPFEATKVIVSMTKNWFVPSSLLAEMRRIGVEKLINNRKIRYFKEWVKPEVYKSQMSYPEDQLTYLGNVANRKAKDFYVSHGVNVLEPAFEKESKQDVPLMFTSHCLRYSMGWCPVYQKEKSPYNEPYHLVHKNTRLRLTFDCKECQMKISIP